MPEPGEGLPEEEFAKLMQSVSAMAPLIKGLMGPITAPESAAVSQKHDNGIENIHKSGQRECLRREALLLALKPYLSPARCAAVDYFIRLSRVGDAIRSLQ